MNPLYISYFTPPYRQEASGLTESLVAHKLPHVITEIEDRGSWERNCAYKPTFIRHMMVSHDCPIVWLDADARVRKKPELFGQIRSDMACHFRYTELLSGTLLFNNSAGAWELLRLWQRECELHAEMWDQKCLQAVLERNPQFTVYALPSEYTRVFDDPKMGEAVIEHRQASRRLKI